MLGEQEGCEKYIICLCLAKNHSESPGKVNWSMEIGPNGSRKEPGIELKWDRSIKSGGRRERGHVHVGGGTF